MTRGVLKARWREAMAYSLSMLITFGGMYLAFTYEGVWLSRAGSLVVCIGVIFSVSRVNEILSAKVGKFVAENYNDVFSEVFAATGQELEQSFTAEQKSKLEAELYKSMVGDINDELDKRKRKLKLHEVAIILAGTLLNGFGDWLVGSLKHFFA